MALPTPVRALNTYLVECFGKADLSGRDVDATDVDRGFLATLVIADDEQLLVLIRGSNAAAVTRRCAAAGLTVDRVVEVALSPAWRWKATGPARRRRAQATPR